MTFHEFPQTLELPRGLVTVDLINERGKVVQREQSENFISLPTQAVARWWQRMMWGMFNPIETNDVYALRPSDMPWFPAEHIAAWTDSAAESPSTETGISGSVVAWASRHPVGTATGKRGLVDISASEFKDASAKWVFNWIGSQGNGTFQSVGWTRIDEGSGYPMRGGLPAETFPIANTGFGTSAGASYNNPTIYWDSVAGLWNIVEHVTAGSGTYRISSVPATGGVTTPICTLPATAWYGGGSMMLCGLAKIGTDFIVSGGVWSGNTTTYLRRYTSAGVQVWTISESLPNSPFWDCTVDGAGDIWTVNNDGKMRRHNPASGATVTTVTPLVTAGPMYGIAYDPADSNFWIYGGTPAVLSKVSSTGTVITQGSVTIGAASGNIASTTPYAGNYRVPGSGPREPYYMVPYISAPSIGGSEIARQPAAWTYMNITMKGSAVYQGVNRGLNQTGANVVMVADAYGSLGSRSRLSSPVVKDSSKSMKITYQFDFS